MNIRGSFSVNTTTAIYLSLFDPTGPVNILDNISRLREPLGDDFAGSTIEFKVGRELIPGLV